MPRLPTRNVKWYGWVPDLPDQRDLAYAAPRARKPLPRVVDLRASFKVPAYDQGELGSCTGNAIAAAVQFTRRKAGERPDFTPSRLFIYYNERLIEGTVEQDSGAQIRDGMKAVAKLGVCPEGAGRKPAPDAWPYDVQRFTQRPPRACFGFGLKHQILAYRRVPQVLMQLRACLASGYPFVFGFTVYSGFESDRVARSGVLDLPGGDEQVMGGHAVLAMGYDDAKQRFLVRNSWGADWGKDGHFTMPYAYLTDRQLASDFWTIRLVES
ncbi:MAG: C1 family peptidase [Anaeromyxobacter sp.]